MVRSIQTEGGRAEYTPIGHGAVLLQPEGASCWHFRLYYAPRTKQAITSMACKIGLIEPMGNGDSRSGRELRAPIHGFVGRTDLEQELIDCAVFQRLRRIKQLALASLVYPGALHTRFDHSVGAMHVAGKIEHAVGLIRRRRGWSG